MILLGPNRPDLLREERLSDILRATARHRPNSTALVFGNRSLTYRELDERSDRTAASLAARGVGSGRVVGLLAPRGIDLIIAQLGITKCGAAWLPFDVDTPLDRVADCQKAAGASGLVAPQSWLPQLESQPAPAWAIETLLSGEGTLSVMPRISDQSDDPAYVIFTSGSTGKPKGIVISHRSICHFLRSENEVLGVREDDRVYAGFSIAFDMSFEELWISFLAGATVWIAPADLVGDPERVSQALRDERITVLHAVPTLMGMLESLPDHLRLINLGGEACPASLVERLARPGRHVFNTYGPTEATVSASAALLEPGRPVTIGSPLPNYGILILDEEQHPVPAGEDGQLAIFGPGLAAGYLGMPELTAEKFIRPTGLQELDGQRLYLTGDLARIDEEGNVHFLGRCDSQVKIRGYRIELSEIEDELVALPDVASAAALVRSIAGTEQIAAFVTAVPGRQIDAANLQKVLRVHLPAYMIPARIQTTSQLPRLPSGKIDRRRLQDLPLNEDDSAAATCIAAARSLAERTLFAAVEKLFPGRTLQPELDFFNDLGGHSLLAARLTSALRSEARYRSISVSDIYRERRLDRIAARMQSLLEQDRATGPVRPAASSRARIKCGAFQAICVPILVTLHISSWLAPFFVYHWFTGDEDDSIALAVLYSATAFAAVQVLLFPVAIGGKWLVAGRLRPGRYPLWSPTYFRWWLADMLCKLPAVRMLNSTPLLVFYLRALGARIGRDVQIDSLSISAPEMLTIGDGGSLGASVQIAAARVERGELVLGLVHLHADAVIDSYCVLESDTVVGSQARLGGLSALAAGSCVPPREMWDGSPARSTDRAVESLPPRPKPGIAAQGARIAFFALAGLSVELLFFLTVFPSFLFLDWLDVHLWNLFENRAHPVRAFLLFFVMGIPASMVLVLATMLLMAGLRRVFLPKQLPGLFSVYSLDYCRKWVLSRMHDCSLSVLYGLYASVFAPSWLRLLGARVGPGAEVSTAEGIVPDLLTIGEHSFIADGVLLGDEEQRGGWIVLRRTSIGNRSFVGNGAYVADGVTVPDDVLIGVQTRTPETADLRRGQTWLGSPPILLPARECLSGFAPELTFRPSWPRKLGRGIVEALRIVLPLSYVIASGYLIVHLAMPLAERDELLTLAGALALAGCGFSFASFLLVVALKWLLIGRYRPLAAPMWTPFVWLSEAVTSLYETLAGPNLLVFLCGTPFLPIALRLLGARIGRGVYLNTIDFTEFDCVFIGDDAELNAGCGPQTHLFEDRVMKIGRVKIGARVTLGAGSTVLYDAEVGDDVVLGPLTLIVKGERVPSGTRWHGSPATPMVGG